MNNFIIINNFIKRYDICFEYKLVHNAAFGCICILFNKPSTCVLNESKSKLTTLFVFSKCSRVEQKETEYN